MTRRREKRYPVLLGRRRRGGVNDYWELYTLTIQTSLLEVTVILYPNDTPGTLPSISALTIDDAVDFRFLLGGVGLLHAERAYG